MNREEYKDTLRRILDFGDGDTSTGYVDIRCNEGINGARLIKYLVNYTNPELEKTYGCNPFKSSKMRYGWTDNIRKLNPELTALSKTDRWSTLSDAYINSPIAGYPNLDEYIQATEDYLLIQSTCEKFGVGGLSRIIFTIDDVSDIKKGLWEVCEKYSTPESIDRAADMFMTLPEVKSALNVAFKLINNSMFGMYGYNMDEPTDKDFVIADEIEKYGDVNIRQPYKKHCESVCAYLKAVLEKA